MLQQRGRLRVQRLCRVQARSHGCVNQQAVSHVWLQIAGALVAAPMFGPLAVVLTSLHPQLFMLQLTEASVGCLVSRRSLCRLPSTPLFAVASSTAGGGRRAIARLTVQETARHDSWHRVAWARTGQLRRVA